LYNSIQIFVGDLTIGGDAPVRIQSMTNTNTLDTESTVQQCIKIIEAGSDLVRLTVRNIKEAENLRLIQKKLRGEGFSTPLIADVHFNPAIAELSATIVEKVRINPGNFAGSDFESPFLNLLQICKEHNTALRIGVNHGSLSERIMNRFGDTPEGMVESAMEYLLVCKKYGFNKVVVSLKSSNTRVMIHANRLLVKTMTQENMQYPIHLGVTEAGEGEDGRIRSISGIGTLLTEGIGDTIRVSLTEEPEREIPTARRIVSLAQSYSIKFSDTPEWSPTEYSRRQTIPVHNIGNNYVPVVIASLSGSSDMVLGDTQIPVPEYYYFRDKNNAERRDINYIIDYKDWMQYYAGSDCHFPLYNVKDFLECDSRSSVLNFVEFETGELNNLTISELKRFNHVVLVLLNKTNDRSLVSNELFNYLIQERFNVPVIIKSTYSESNYNDYLSVTTFNNAHFFLDGLADGFWLENPNFPVQINNSLTFDILQASRARTYKTEFIACPSCGRTLFNIQKTLSQVQQATSHLNHLKIAVMGCIVNGPGEMADADYGYVGSSAGKIALYKNKILVKKNIPEEKAIVELVNLIKENNDWIEDIGHRDSQS